MNSTIRRIGAFAAAAALTVTLASCSGGQSVEEACKIAESATTEALGDVETMTQEMLQGGNLGETFAKVTDALAEAQKQVTNKEVSAALAESVDGVRLISDSLKDFEMPDLSNIDFTDPEAMAQLEELSAKAEEMSAKMEAQGDKLTKAGEKLEALCGA